MTVTEFGTVTAADTVRFDRLLPGPIERVWAFLTEPDKRAQWLAGGPMELHPGGKVELHFQHADLSKHAEPVPERFKKKLESGPTMHGRVTRAEPPRLLSYTWGGEAGAESEVTFELTPQGDKVRLLLTHRRLDRKAMLGVGPGWHTRTDRRHDRRHNRGAVPPAAIAQGAARSPPLTAHHKSARLLPRAPARR
jgi:uncharacterized protein YndB with AHSA1/START domain